MFIKSVETIVRLTNKLLIRSDLFITLLALHYSSPYYSVCVISGLTIVSCDSCVTSLSRIESRGWLNCPFAMKPIALFWRSHQRLRATHNIIKDLMNLQIIGPKTRFRIFLTLNSRKHCVSKKFLKNTNNDFLFVLGLNCLEILIFKRSEGEQGINKQIFIAFGVSGEEVITSRDWLMTIGLNSERLFCQDNLLLNHLEERRLPCIESFARLASRVAPKAILEMPLNQTKCFCWKRFDERIR